MRKPYRKKPSRQHFVATAALLVVAGGTAHAQAFTELTFSTGAGSSVSATTDGDTARAIGDCLDGQALLQGLPQTFYISGSQPLALATQPDSPLKVRKDAQQSKSSITLAPNPDQRPSPSNPTLTVTTGAQSKPFGVRLGTGKSIGDDLRAGAFTMATLLAHAMLPQTDESTILSIVDKCVDRALPATAGRPLHP
jgi:hypothetical protein